VKNISPLVGFNTNVRHKGKVFHIQTEDSGIKHPHVITHLFADGGRILKSTKASYAELLNEPDLTDRVRTLMKDQHKAMFMALRDGSLDSTIDEFVRGGAPARPSATSTAAAQPKPAAAPPPDPVPEPAAVSVRADPAAAQAWQAAAPSTPQPALGPAAEPKPAAAAAEAGPAADASRYVASRPAAIFASSRPAEGRNVFGEEMISDKSLDEVILSFLADEVDAGSDKGGGKH